MDTPPGGDFMPLRLLATTLLILGLLIQPLEADAVQAPPSCQAGMEWIPGGTFRMGSDDHYPDELSADAVTVEGFCIDRHEVTNAEFDAFVTDTGYVTVAERPIPKDQYPDLAEDQRAPGALVFAMPPAGTKVTEVSYLSWWHWTPGANWRHPQGPESDLEGLANHPVVQVAFRDAEAYAAWAGKELPTEAQWEFAARGGLKDQIFSWGKTYSAKKANTWQGEFPIHNQEKDGYFGTAPVGSFPPNGYGLQDMTGNVWEWTQDWYRPGHQGMADHVNPAVTEQELSFDPREPGIAKHVIKGGSFLCAKNYCSRYRPAAREALEPDTGTSHIGFRLVTSPTEG
nr:MULTISPECIES: formylglycine-generating enzyme family protein [unclassified Synechococcus]